MSQDHHHHGTPDHGNHDHAGSDQPSAAADATFGLHGQLLVGEGPLYLSHLPMFMFDPKDHAHNFQVILEVTLEDDGSDPQRRYVEDRRQHPDSIYTLRPDPFHMVDLVSPEAGRPLRRAFPGLVVRGHFERGGLALPDLRPASPSEPPADVTVRVADVIYFQGFRPDAVAPVDLEYLLFGTPAQLFAAHIITRPPDFDQMLAVRIDGEAADEAALRRGLRVAVPNRANAIGKRLKPGERVAVEALDPAVGTLQLDVVAELYLEEGELRLPPDFAPTPEEIAASMP